MGLGERLRRWFGSSRPEDYDPEHPAGRAKARKAKKSEKPRPGESRVRGARGIPPAPLKRKVSKIEGPVLDLIAEAARASHPNEFGGTLRAEGDIVTELILVPATQGGARMAILPLYNLPIDASIIGTVHSHPSPFAIPSDADLQLFRHFGHTHIIIANPYTRATWRAYDQEGREVALEVVD